MQSTQTSELFPIFMERLLDHEGGYVNDPRDPGGETKFGISKRSYPSVIIKELTREQALAIYYRDFWLPLLEVTPSRALLFQFLDSAVNSGIFTTIRFIQRAVGVADDGYIGIITRAAIKSATFEDLILLFNAERILYMTKLKNFDAHGKGWMRRIAKNLQYAAEDN